MWIVPALIVASVYVSNRSFKIGSFFRYVVCRPIGRKTEGKPKAYSEAPTWHAPGPRLHHTTWAGIHFIVPRTARCGA